MGFSSDAGGRSSHRFAKTNSAVPSPPTAASVVMSSSMAHPPFPPSHRSYRRTEQAPCRLRCDRDVWRQSLDLSREIRIKSRGDFRDPSAANRNGSRNAASYREGERKAQRKELRSSAREARTGFPRDRTAGLLGSGHVTRTAVRRLHTGLFRGRRRAGQRRDALVARWQHPEISPLPGLRIG